MTSRFLEYRRAAGLAGAAGLLAAAQLAAGSAAADNWSTEAGLAHKANIETLVGQSARKSDKSEAEAIKTFYEGRDHRPLWFDDGRPSRRAGDLFTALREVSAHGLDPAHYGMPQIVAQVEAARDPATRARVELELTRTLIRYAGDLSAGSVAPARAAPGIYRRPERPDPTRILAEAGDAPNFASYLKSLEPSSRRYQQLKTALARYRALAAKGGWKPVTEGPTLKPGMKDPRLLEVRARLRVTGDLTETSADETEYDKVLEKAVARFQDRHGLTEDGVVGPNTIKAMNVPVDERIRQIAINMERRRWMPNNLGRTHVWVNIADFYVKVVRDTETIHTARIVVGKSYTKTPIFSSTMKYIIFNPRWNVPYSIASKEMLPKIRKDPSYLARNNYRLVGPDGQPVDPHSVDWNEVSARNFRYQVRQTPGPGNALGRIVFMFPNKYNVFIHDTNARHLFGRTVRAFSHGCMRVQNPEALALLLLREKGGWSMDRIQQTIARGESVNVFLKEPLRVHVTYMTAWANRDGTVEFRRDIYGRDAALERALDRTLTR